MGVLDFAAASSGNGSSRASWGGGDGEGAVRSLTVVEGVEEVSGPRHLCPFTTEHQAGGSFNWEKAGPIFDRQVTLGFQLAGHLGYLDIPGKGPGSFEYSCRVSGSSPARAAASTQTNCELFRGARQRFSSRQRGAFEDLDRESVPPTPGK